MQRRLQLPVTDPLVSLTSRLRTVAAACLLAILSAVSARAISVIPPTFPELVQLSTEIVRVEVLDVSSRLDSADANSLVHTYVRCRVLRAMKGGAQDAITLRLLGGRAGDAVLEVADMPVFVVGEKYICFVAQNGRAFCPLVGVMHGTYPVVADDTAAGTERVLRNNREPLLALAEVDHPMADGTSPPGTRAALSSALSVTDFEAAIVREIANAKQP